MATECSVSLCEPPFFIVRCERRTDACSQLEIEYYVSDPVRQPNCSLTICMNSDCLFSYRSIIYISMRAVKTEPVNAEL